jgi:tetratricopeptide (TPR) repeat protein
MSRSVAVRLLVACSILAFLLTGCSRDPNVRKQKYFESGQKYFAEGKYHEAMIQYSNAIQIDPNFAQGYYGLGEAYLKIGDMQHAGQALSRTVDLDANNYRARTDLANLLLPGGNPDNLREAKKHLDILREKQPNNPETREAWANYYAAQKNTDPAAEQKNIDLAMGEMRQAIAEDPNRSESYLLLALLQQRSSMFDDAESNYKKAVSVDPKALNAQMGLGGFYQTRNRLPEAEQQFRQAIAVDPKNPGPRAAMVRLLMQEGKRGAAESFLQQTKRDLADVGEGYRMLGDFYYATGDIDKAASEYSSLYSDHPKDPLVKRNYIQILILKNRLDEATKLNNEILKNNANDVDSLVFRGQIQLRQNNSAGAVETLQIAVRNDSSNAVAHYQLGLAYEQQHNQSRAESEWREAVRLRPDMIEAQRSLAVLERQRGDSAALVQTAQQIIAAQPGGADGYLLKGMAEIQQGKFSDAQHDAEQAMQRAPQTPAPYIQLGNINLAQKQYADAVKYYQEALDKDPGSSDGLSGVMNTYFAQKEFDKAIAAANAQIAKSPGNSGFYDLLGTALFNGKKDLPGAEAALRKAVEYDKTNTDAVEKLGKVEIQEGAADKALALYQQAIKDTPREVIFYVLSGELYESQHNWDQAKNMYQQALAVQPDHPLAANNLAYVILEQGGNVDVALAMAQTARRGLPDYPNAADTLGWAYYQKGIYQSAIGQFQEALRLSEKHGMPDSGTVHYHLGLAYQKANQLPLARQQLEKAVKLSPTNTDAKKALSELRG